MIFDINYPTKVIIGEDASSQTGKKLKEHNISRVLCIYDPIIRSAGLIDKIFSSIKNEGIKVVEFDGIKPDPPDTVVDEAGELGRREGVGAVVGIGGGSCLDTAKAVNVLLGNPGWINKYYGKNIVQQPCKLLVLMPTTSGTGSEISQISAITDTKSGRKNPVFGPNCTANIAIVDPLLTVSLPPFITAYTGVDALAHAIEAYTSAVNTPISDIVALEAITLISKSLAVAVKEGSNIKARFDMSFASTLAGMAFFQSPPHIGHSIATPIGGRYHLAHGLAVSTILPCMIDYISDAIPDRIRTISEAMGMNLAQNLSGEQVGHEISNAIRELNKGIGLPTLKQLNIPEADFPIIAKEALEEPMTEFYPKMSTSDDFIKLLRGEYAQ